MPSRNAISRCYSRDVLALGVEQGMVRTDIEVSFVIEYWLQIAKGMHDPAVMARTGLEPRAAFRKAMDLFFCGLLTPAGRTCLETPRS